MGLNFMCDHGGGVDLRTRRISMIVLAGGKSRRMGMNKSDLILRGRSFLEIQAEKAKELDIQDVVISGYQGQRPFDFPVIPDDQAEKGPLGGISTCLEAVQNEWALVLSVDAPLVPVEELEKLVDFALQGPYQAAITRCGGWQYPLIGMYHRSLADAMREEIALRKGSVFSLLRQTGYGIYDSNANPVLFANVNDQESYQRLLTL